MLEFGSDSLLSLCIAVVLVVLGFVLILHACATTEDGRDATAIVFFAMLAASPVWGSTLYVILGSFAVRPAGEYAVAPWLIVGFSARFALHSLLTAAIAAVVYMKTSFRPIFKLMLMAVMPMILAAAVRHGLAA